MSIGRANPIPSALGIPREFMPTTLPFMSTRGPPEFPGLMEASVWIHTLKIPVSSPVGRRNPSGRVRSVLLTTPKLTLRAWDRGAPMARTRSPTCTSPECPSVAQVTPGALRCTSSMSSWRRATSVQGSDPTRRAFTISLL
jgi:hypothetical protein